VREREKKISEKTRLHKTEMDASSFCG